MTARDGDDRDRADWGADPELLDVLRGADPAHSLPPLLPSDLDRLVRATLDADAGAAAPTQGAVIRLDTHRLRRRVLAPLAAAAAVAFVGGIAVTSLRDGPDAAVEPGRTPVAEAPVGPTVLTVPAPGRVRCAVPTAESLAAQQQAFEGTVTALADGTATLQVDNVYAGEVADQVQVQAPSADMGALLSAVRFETGRSYLVSATDGQVTLCGYSAEARPALETLYEQAFVG